MNRLSLVQALAPAHWPVLVLVSGRIVGLMLVAPLWSMASVPRAARGAMVVLFTVCVLPTVPATALPPDYPGLLAPIATELLLGLSIGLVGAVFTAGVGMAGELASMQMGLNLGPALSPMADSTVTGVGELKNLLALAIYAALGGHLLLLTGVSQSLAVIPPGGVIDAVQGGRTVVALAGTVFETALRAAAPVIVALLLANFALAILSRAVPQLQAMAIAFPITIGLGLLIIGAALPYTGAFVAEWAATLPGTAARVVGAFTPAGAQ